MQLTEVLKQITNEARILESHLACGKADERFVQVHADSLVSYGLLLRDLSAEHTPRRRNPNPAFDIFSDLR